MEDYENRELRKVQPKGIKTFPNLQEIMWEEPSWDWVNLDGQGFYELMQAYRNAPLAPQAEVVRCFEMVKEYIRWYCCKHGLFNYGTLSEFERTHMQNLSAYPIFPWRRRSDLEDLRQRVIRLECQLKQMWMEDCKIGYRKPDEEEREKK